MFAIQRGGAEILVHHQIVEKALDLQSLLASAFLSICLVPRLGCVAIRGCFFHPNYERSSSLPTQLTSQIIGNCSFSPTPLQAAEILAVVFRHLMQIYANWSVYLHAAKHCLHGTGNLKLKECAGFLGSPPVFKFLHKLRFVCVVGQGQVSS